MSCGYNGGPEGFPEIGATSGDQTMSIQPAPDLLSIFKTVPQLSYKVDTYFAVYERLFGHLRGKPITFVEIGVLNGGSLFMWREFFGPQARIIGIELNPAAKEWEKHGFEIFTANQSDEAFWDRFYSEVGPIDILLDDGGHSNLQQVTTTAKAIEKIKDGGLVVVEDVHSSYMPEFGNPSGNSFIKFAFRIVDAINGRFQEARGKDSLYFRRVFSVEFYESIVVFRVDGPKCTIGIPVSNEGETRDAVDYSYAKDSKAVERNARRRFNSLKKIPGLKPLALGTFRVIHNGISRVKNATSGQLRKHFQRAGH
jgi:hypothetical protein